MPVEGRDLSSWRTQHVVRDLEIGQLSLGDARDGSRWWRAVAVHRHGSGSPVHNVSDPRQVGTAGSQWTFVPTRCN